MHSTFKCLLIFSFLPCAELFSREGPASNLRSVSVGALDKAVTIRMKLKTTTSVNVFISGNVESLGNWIKPCELQNLDPNLWEITFKASRSDLGSMNIVVFKVSKPMFLVLSRFSAQCPFCRS